MVARLVARLDGMPLAIELAAARVEALGVTGLLDRIDDRFALLTEGDRVAADRQRSLAATVEWSYRLLEQRERRVFRAVSVFPAGFTLEGAEAVAGAGAGLAVLRLVDCSLLVPPQAGPDGRLRYVMLETLRAYGARLLAGAGEQDGADVALAGYTLEVAEQAAAGLQTSAAEEVAAARWLDAEDATTRQALAWAMVHDPDMALRLAVTLAPWCMLRDRLVSHRPLLREAAAYAAPGSDGWCAAQYWLGHASLFTADMPGALGYFTRVCDAIGDRPPSRVVADCLRGRSGALANMGHVAEAADDARRALALARELGDPAREAVALDRLAVAVFRVGDLHSAVQLAMQAEKASVDVPGWIAGLRKNSVFLALVLTEAGELAEAGRVCAAGLDRAREAGDSWTQTRLLVQMATLDLRAARIENAAAHLREALQIAARTGDQFEVQNHLDCCGYLRAATGRYADAVTVWAAHAALLRRQGYGNSPAEARRQQEALHKARQALGPDHARAAEERGTAMSRDTAADYALVLTDLHLPRSAPGLGELSARERELVTLVAQGRTNAQIAAQLYISVRTVSSHLDRIRDKTGYRRRADLTRLALSEGLV
ncbi:MAG TPA: LuxR C-terminal-related transcriptional regulator [Streptosporangiaceae bacterium]|nr:LuxR C-terminal-related transcriptional regulator [Streptosporangiaceae bacterium]